MPLCNARDRTCMAWLITSTCFPFAVQNETGLNGVACGAGHEARSAAGANSLHCALQETVQCLSTEYVSGPASYKMLMLHEAGK
jgi:hypothetical protein